MCYFGRGFTNFICKVSVEYIQTISFPWTAACKCIRSLNKWHITCVTSNRWESIWRIVTTERSWRAAINISIIFTFSCRTGIGWVWTVDTWTSWWRTSVWYWWRTPWKRFTKMQMKIICWCKFRRQRQWGLDGCFLWNDIGIGYLSETRATAIGSHFFVQWTNFSIHTYSDVWNSCRRKWRFDFCKQ